MRTVEARPVLDGQKVKWTLEQIEQSNQSRVRLDWLRFTVPLDAVIRSDNELFDLTVVDLLDKRGRDLVRMSRGVDPEAYTTAHKVSHAGACLLVELLGCLTVGAVEEKGMDYYSARTALMHEGAVVGWCLAGAKAANQAGTVHFNLFGSAMLEIPMDRLPRIAEFVSQSNGRITRADLSLDVWTGHRIEDVRSAYLAGEFDVRGKRPGQREHGSWTLGHSRTFEVGSRATGKMFRGYEKGHEQFGPEVPSEWLRYEVELRDNHRVIDVDVLTRPADYFAGTYGFCARVLADMQVSAEAQTIKTTPELKDVNAEASVVRVVRWLRRTAAPAMVAALRHCDVLETIFDSEAHRVPRRLLGIGPELLRASFVKVAEALAPAPAPSFIGAV